MDKLSLGLVSDSHHPYFLVSEVRTGYSDDGPAPSSLDVYSPPSSTFVSAYTPPPPGSTPTPTMPPIPVSNALSSYSSRSSGLMSTPPPTVTGTKTGKGNATAIELGTIFGIIVLLVVVICTVYYIRRRRQLDGARQFMALSDEDADIIGETHQIARPIPIAKMHNAPSSHGILGSLGAVLKIKSPRSIAPRRDMLADEDARSLGEWYNRQRSVAGSTWSLKSILVGGMRTRGRQASTTTSPNFGEKDPFADQESVMRDERTGLISLTTRVPSRLSRQETSHHSWRSGSSYRDPFSDPIYDNTGHFDSAELYQDYGHIATANESTEASERHIIRASSRPPLPQLQSVLPVVQGGHLLSPLLEHTSQSTLPSQKISPSNSSHDHSANDIPLTALDSGLSSPSVPPRPSSIINTSNSSLLSGGSLPIRRSDSWWSRFSRVNLLDRRSSGTLQKATYEIRDPNPPPKLGAIEESTSPQASPPGVADGEDPSQPPTLGHTVYPPGHRPQELHHTHSLKAIPSRVYGADEHGKSLSSLRTADSEAIERMAGTMDVVHYLKSRSQSGYRNSVGGLSIDTSSSASVSEREDKNVNVGREGLDDDNLILFASPLETKPTSPTFRHPLAADQGDDPTLPDAVDAALPANETQMANLSTVPTGSVNDMVQQFERRMSMEAPVSQTTPNTKHREERTKKRVEVNYGLAPKPSLYVANPDRSASGNS